MSQRSLYKKWVDDEELKDKLTLITAYARDGLTNEQIAYNLGINDSTLYGLQKKHKDIKDALKRGKEVVDIQVENALLKRALGYKYDEITKELTGNKEDGYQIQVTKIVTKEVSPDTTAQIYWLKNRKNEQWNDRKNAVENMDIEDLTTVAEMLNKGGAPHVEENTND